MNDDRLAELWQQSGLFFFRTTISLPNKLEKRVRNLLSSNEFVTHRLLQQPAKRINGNGLINFNPKQEEFLFCEPSTKPNYKAEERPVGKIQISVPIAPVQNGKQLAFPLLTTEDSLPDASDYQMHSIERPKRPRNFLKQSDIGKKKRKDLAVDGYARTSVVPEQFIESKVFNASDDEGEDGSDDMERMELIRGPRKPREPSSIYANRKDWLGWAELQEANLAGDELVWRKGNRAKKSFVNRIPAALPSMVRISDSSYVKMWSKFFKLSILEYMNDKWKSGMLRCDGKHMTNSRQIQFWFLGTVMPKIREKLKKSQPEYFSTISWVLAYDKITLKDTGKTKALILFEEPMQPDLQPQCMLKLLKPLALEIELLWLCCNPISYIRRRALMYFVQFCTDNQVTTLVAFTSALQMRSNDYEKEIEKQFKIWWSHLAACGADYISGDIQRENPVIEQAESGEVEQASLIYH